MPILILFCIIPILAGALAEYLVCRFAKRRPWRWAPPLFCLAGTAVVALSRYYGWSMEHTGAGAPIETLLFVPGLPAALLFVGLFAGWRLWKRLWGPRVINK